MRLVIALLCVAARMANACDVCDGLAARKVASGEVLEISDEGQERLVVEHALTALLLYKPYDPRTQPLQQAFDEVAISLKDSGLLQSCVMAQINVESFPRAASLLNVESVELPAIRILRGDAAFGYPLRSAAGGAQALLAQLRTEITRLPAPAIERLDPDDLAEFEATGKGTRVVAELTDSHSVRALGQVTHALHGAVRFAMPQVAPPTAPHGGATSAPSPPPVARVRLVREVSADFDGEEPALEMPRRFPTVAGEAPASAAGGASHAVAAPAAPASHEGRVGAQQLYRWVRWAALPSVFALTPQTATTYLVEGASGVLFVPGAAGSNRTRDYAVRRLRKLASRLRDAGDHGLWLLWADRHDQSHARLRAQLGLADGAGAGVAGGATAAAGGAADGSEFAIVVMAGARILHRFPLPPPFTFERVYEHCTAFLRGELLAQQRRAHNLRVLGSALATLLLVIGGAPIWRRIWHWYRGGAPPGVPAPPSSAAPALPRARPHDSANDTDIKSARAAPAAATKFD